MLALSFPVWVGGSLRVQLPALNLRPGSADPAQRTGTGPSAHTNGPEEETQATVVAHIWRSVQTLVCSSALESQRKVAENNGWNAATSHP